MNIIVIKHIKKILIVLIVVFVIVAGVVLSEGGNYSSGIYDLPINFSLSNSVERNNELKANRYSLSKLFFSGLNNTIRSIDVSDWNNLALQFQNAPSGETIRFLNNIEAIVGQTNTSFGASAGNHFTIDGQGFMLDSKDQLNLGFRLSGTALTFRDISFSSFNTAFRINGTSVDGGALYVNSGNVVFTGSVSFSHNRVEGGDGGALSATNRSVIDFRDSFVTFFANEGFNGTAFSLFNSMVNFKDSTVNFTSNSNNTIYGWALYMPLGSSANFINSEVNFNGNLSGGIVGGRLLNFKNSSAVFANNRDVISGVGSVNFEDSNIIFSENEKALVGNYMKVKFLNSKLTFRDNRVSAGRRITGGGAIGGDFNGRLNLIVSNSQVDFTSNSASDRGGAIYYIDGTFIDSKINFIANRADGNDFRNDKNSGGAISDSNINSIGSTLTFIDNSASNKGGAIYLINGENNFINSSVSFINNKAQYGGAIFLSLSTLNFVASYVDFTSNSIVRTRTGSDDAAIALHSEKSFINFLNSKLNFSGHYIAENMSRGAVYLVTSKVNFANSDVNFVDNVAAGQRFSLGGALGSSGSSINFTNTRLNFSKNSANYSGGAVWFIRSTVSFVNSIVNIASNTAEIAGGINMGYSNITFSGSTINFVNNSAILYGGGAMSIEHSYIDWNNSSITFINNSAAQSGGAIRSRNGNIIFTNSILAFTGNSAGSSGGAISTSVSSISFNGANSVLFSNNSVNGKPNDIYIENSSLFMSGSIAINSGIQAENASFISLSSATLHLSGVNDFDNLSSFELQDSLMIAANATFTYKGGAPISAKDSTLIFEGDFSSITFIDGQILLSGRNSARPSSLIFNPAGKKGSIVFTNGIRVSGGEVIKKGEGRAVFGGQYSEIKSDFAIEQGSAVFYSQASSINVLKVSPGATLDMSAHDKYGRPYKLYISTFVLSGFLSMDFIFSSNQGDFISADYLKIDKSSLVPSVIKNDNIVVGSSLPFIEANSITGRVENLVSMNLDYRIELKGNTLWLLYYPLWDAFVDDYRNAQSGAKITLKTDTQAYSEKAQAISTTTARDIIVDGKNFELNSMEMLNKGFILRDNSISFMDIKFSSFIRNGARLDGDGGLMNISASTIIFSRVLFKDNIAQGRGGAIYAKNSNIKIIDSHFVGNKSAQTLPNYPSLDNIVAIKALASPNDIHLAGGVRLELVTQDNDIRMDGGIESENDGNVIRKLGAKTLIFEKSAQINIQKGEFLIEQGSVKFDVIRSSIERLNISNAMLAINADFTGNETSLLYVSSINISASAKLSVSEINRSLTLGERKDFLYAEDKNGAFAYENIISQKDKYSFEWRRENDRWIGSIEFLGTPVFMGSTTINGAFYANLRDLGTQTNFSFANLNIARKQSQKFWIMGIISGADISQKHQENFRTNARGFKVGADLVNNGGIFVGWTKIEAWQASSKANGSDSEFGLYKIWLSGPAKINALLSFGLQNMRTKDGIDLNSKSARIILESEFYLLRRNNWDGGFFVGIRGGYSALDKIRKAQTDNWTFITNKNELIMEKINENDKRSGGADDIPSSRRARLEVLGGIVSEHKIERFTLSARLYGGFTAIGDKMKFNTPYGDMIGADAKPFGGILAGVDFEMNEQASLFTGGGFEMSENRRGYNANLGIRFRFAQKRLKVKKQEPKSAVKELIQKRVAEVTISTPPSAISLEQTTKTSNLVVESTIATLSPAPMTSTVSFIYIKISNGKEATPSQAKEIRNNAKKMYRLSAASFVSNSTSLSPKARINLSRLAPLIIDIGFKRILVEGHADSSGRKSSNLTLSRRRAMAVAAELIANGIPQEMVHFIGMGSESPIKTNRTKSGRELNRRVDIVIE